MLVLFWSSSPATYQQEELHAGQEQGPVEEKEHHLGTGGELLMMVVLRFGCPAVPAVTCPFILLQKSEVERLSVWQNLYGQTDLNVPGVCVCVCECVCACVCVCVHVCACVHAYVYEGVGMYNYVYSRLH